MNNEMLLARRRIMMAKKKPSFHVWDGSRDYSFLTSSNTLYIDTPEKFAGLMAVSLNFAQYDNRPDLVDSRLQLNGKTVKLAKDLYFNEDYLDSDNFVSGSNKQAMNGQYDSDRDLTHHNLAYTTFGDGIVRSLYLNITCFVFDGQYHKLVGLYSNLSNETVSMPSHLPRRYLVSLYNDISPVVAKNFVLEHCVMKNGMYSRGGYELGVALVNAKTVATNSIDIINVSAKFSTVCGGCSIDSNASRQILIDIINDDGANAKPNIRNVNTQDCHAYVNDSTAVFTSRRAGTVLSSRQESTTYGKIANTSDFMFATNNWIAYSGGRMADVVDKRFIPIPSHIYCFGNTGVIDDVNNPTSLQTMPSKAALIAQVNDDITANASGDLSLLDSNGNFAGICP